LLLRCIALLGTSVPAESQSVESPVQVLAYSVKPSSLPRSVLLIAPGGGTYRLSLVPEFDTGNHVVVLELVLRRPHARENDSNLLDAGKNWHGYQPFFFAASDFAAGAQHSRYGDSRAINLPRLRMQVRTKVTEVNVEKTSTNSPLGPVYQFDSLTVEVATKKLEEKPNEKPGN